MKWVHLIVFFFIVYVIVLYEWPKIEPKYKKEKVAFIVLTLLGSILLSVLIIFPDIQGPFDWFKKIYSPFIHL